MPRTYPPKRTMISVRLNPSAVAEVDKLAGVEQIGRSKMIRLLLAEALATRKARSWPPPPPIILGGSTGMVRNGEPL